MDYEHCPYPTAFSVSLHDTATLKSLVSLYRKSVASPWFVNVERRRRGNNTKEIIKALGLYEAELDKRSQK